MPTRPHESRFIDRLFPDPARKCPGTPTRGADGVASAYLAAERAGATPERLRVLLYDGAIGLCREALTALDFGDAKLAADRLARARASVSRLHGCLQARTGREGRFLRLYETVQRCLGEADYYRRREPLCESITMLLDRRMAWLDLDPAERSCPPIEDAGCRSWVG
jgi:flagellin-specific chaperone FliS